MAQVYIKIPTGFTFSKIKEGVNLTNLNNYYTSVGQPTLSVEDANPFWDYVLELGVTGNITRTNSNNEMSLFGPLERVDHIDFDPVYLASLVGGSVEGLPVWVEVDEENYNDEVTSSLPNRVYTDENEVEQVRVWSEWKDSNHEHQKFGTKWYVPGNSFGMELHSNEFLPLHTNPPTGVKLLKQSEFKVIQVANQSDEV